MNELVEQQDQVVESLHSDTPLREDDDGGRQDEAEGGENEEIKEEIKEAPSSRREPLGPEDVEMEFPNQREVEQIPRGGAGSRN